MSVLIFTRLDVEKAANSSIIRRDRAVQAFRNGNPRILKEYLARAVFKKWLNRPPLYHRLRRWWLRMPKREYAMDMAHRFLIQHPIQLEKINWLNK
ncbi:MAG: hypothetical protein V3T23_04010 [Nitrososphaerales archaeon]